MRPAVFLHSSGSPRTFLGINLWDRPDRFSSFCSLILSSGGFFSSLFCFCLGLVKVLFVVQLINHFVNLLQLLYSVSHEWSALVYVMLSISCSAP